MLPVHTVVGMAAMTSDGHLAHSASRPAPGRGARIVLTAPLTETIDHAGFFIQMAMASLPIWLEGLLDRRYPGWRRLEHNDDGSARTMPAGVRILEASLLRRFSADDVVCCYPDDLPRVIGPETRVVAVSTHNPLGVTFAAGVYASMFGSSKEPINSRYARALFDTLQSSPYRPSFRVIVGGSGGWQIVSTNAFERLGVDCVVEGRAEAPETIELFERALEGRPLPRRQVTEHPKTRDAILVPEKRTTFGVVEMTTGCGRRCHFCVPDLNPQLDVPKERILAAVRANVREGNRQISLATEDMFIWGQVRTGTPFYFPNREALLDLYTAVVETPGVEAHVLSHATMAPAIVDPVLISELSARLLDKSPIRLPRVSTHPEGRALSPLIGLETGSVRVAQQIMPGKAVPFPIDQWPSVVVRGLEVLNAHNWFPVMTLIVGSPGETDEDCRATLDLIHEVQRRRLFAIFVPSIFTPLHDTRMETTTGVAHTQQLTALQWQVIMTCWKNNLGAAVHSWWAPGVWRLGALLLWAFRLRRLNGPAFTWPLFLFAGVLPESWLLRIGRLHRPRPLPIRTRAELLATIRPNHRKFLRADTGDLPGDTDAATESSPPPFIPLMPAT
jgi:radical SAM superfamily enzyme YgiQ (UPF0313 family)